MSTSTSERAVTVPGLQRRQPHLLSVTHSSKVREEATQGPDPSPSQRVACFPPCSVLTPRVWS